jgi:MFS family permease
VLVWSTGLFGLGLIGLSFARHAAVAWLVLVGASGGMMVLTAASNTVLQTIVEDDKRGRVMSLYTTVFLGIAPVGSLVAGSVAMSLGAPQTVRIGGVGCLLGAIVFARHLPTLRDSVRPIYAKMGLMQDAASRTQRALDASLQAHH